MPTVRLASPVDFDGWRDAARGLLRAGVAPHAVAWQVGGEAAGLLDNDAADPERTGGKASPTVPAAFFDLARAVICHHDPERFALLHQLVHRLATEPGLLDVAVDPLVARLGGMAKAVRRDIHKMHAFVRFREVGTEHGGVFIAWFEPGHHIVEAAAPFFQRRFAGMRWSILTPERCAHWNGEVLHFSDGVTRAEAPDDDAMEALWRGYYAAIFNPARLKVAMMASEMPRKYWRNLPEAPLITPLIRSAAERSAAMLTAHPTTPGRRPQRTPDVPARDEAQHRSETVSDVAGLREAAQHCRACPLWADATQTVFGEGPDDASVVFVGEQPGDKEDLAGRPFVGPAGQLFDRALAEAGVDRSSSYVTNAVKHFKFEPRGKFRLHKRPNAGEIQACRWWVSHEIGLIRPKLVVALGATAVQSLFGKAMPLNANRGRIQRTADGHDVFVTVHPSYLLRLPDERAREAEYGRFVEDLRLVAQRLAA